MPVSTPWAIGDQTIWPMPARSLAGMTSASITRQSIEYCGWLLTSGTRSSRASAAALARELKVPLVSNQPQYSMLWRVIEAEVIPMCERLGIGQIVWSPIAQGVLTGKYLPGQPPPEGSRATDERGSQFIARLLTDDVLTRVQKLKPIARETGLSMAQLAVAWVLHNPNVSSAIVGASRPEQVHDNAKASGVKLDAAILKKIDEVLGGVVVRDPKMTVSPTKRP